MTVIAYKDGVLAADTLVTSGFCRVGHTLKITSVKQDGVRWMIGMSGNPGAMVPARNWISEGADLSKPIQFNGLEDAYLLFIHQDGRTFHADTTSPYLFGFSAPYSSLGSGSEFASMAMELGRSAIEAVELACRLDIGCGGNVTYLRLDGKTEDLELPKEIYKPGN